MLAGRDVEARGRGVVDHHPVGAAIDPALIGIATDIEAACPDVPPAVWLVPFGRGKTGDVDIGALHDIFEDRAAIDVGGSDAFHRHHKACPETFAQIDLAEVGRKAERHVLALAAEEIDQHAAPRNGSRDVIEDEAGGVVIMRRDARNHPDVLLPGEPAHILDLAELARLLEPFPQIVVDDPRRDVGRGNRDHGIAHGISPRQSNTPHRR